MHSHAVTTWFYIQVWADGIVKQSIVVWNPFISILHFCCIFFALFSGLKHFFFLRSSILLFIRLRFVLSQIFSWYGHFSSGKRNPHESGIEILVPFVSHPFFLFLAMVLQSQIPIRHTFGSSNNNIGLMLLLDKTPGISHWRHVARTHAWWCLRLLGSNLSSLEANKNNDLAVVQSHRGIVF